ncbi:hypothetical protein [Pseudomonas morbosilactucae]|nr:hypothetical protein [Pseudomonas morbosilactucae]
MAAALQHSTESGQQAPHERLAPLIDARVAGWSAAAQPPDID